MTLLELQALVVAVCPIVGMYSDGAIVFDQSATAAQKTAAQSVVSANLSKLNGQPTRIPLPYTQCYNQLKTLTQAQQLQVLAMVCSFDIVNNPQLAQAINTALGLSLPYDQANPQG